MSTRLYTENLSCVYSLCGKCSFISVFLLCASMRACVCVYVGGGGACGYVGMCMYTFVCLSLHDCQGKEHQSFSPKVSYAIAWFVRIVCLTLYALH